MDLQYRNENEKLVQVDTGDSFGLYVLLDVDAFLTTIMSSQTFCNPSHHKPANASQGAHATPGAQPHKLSFKFCKELLQDQARTCLMLSLAEQQTHYRLALLSTGGAKWAFQNPLHWRFEAAAAMLD